MGLADAATTSSPRAALCPLHGGRSEARGADDSADRQRTLEEGCMTSPMTLALRARNTQRVRPRYQICLIHPFDPRGEKVGGLETYIQDFITFHPEDTDLLF